MAHGRNKTSGNDGAAPSGFSSTLLITLTSLGAMVGTGNIWRFPRILAQNGDGGCLVFLIVWTLFLFLWSIPIVSLEYSSGRYTNLAVIPSFKKLMGDKWAWCGLWVALVSLFVGAEYSVICGWCLYYIYLMIAVDPPQSNEESEALFYQFTKESYWPIFCTAIALLLAALFVSKGVATIEKANLVLVPLLLLIILFTLIWSLTQQYADIGIKFLFKPKWESFANPRVWVDACGQNAFDSGGGIGHLATYSTVLGPQHCIVKYSIFNTLGNQLVSFACALIIFITVFSVFTRTAPWMTEQNVVTILQNNGPASSGLTFIWIPVLYSELGVLGRVVCVLFFICLSCAALSSLIGFIEMQTLPITQFGLPRWAAILISTLLTFSLGLGSALSLDFLTNQDFVFGFALVISGLMFIVMAIKYGVSRYRRDAFNNHSQDDWYLPRIWDFVIILAPLEVLALVGWWMFDTIITAEKHGQPWYYLGTESLLTTLLEWAGILMICLLVNLILYKLKPRWYTRVTSDEDPYEVPILKTPSYGAILPRGPLRGSYQSLDSRESLYEELQPNTPWRQSYKGLPSWDRVYEEVPLTNSRQNLYSDESLYDGLESDTPLQRSYNSLASSDRIYEELPFSSQENLTYGHSLYEELRAKTSRGRRKAAENVYEGLQTETPLRRSYKDSSDHVYEELPLSSHESLASGSSFYEVPNTAKKGGHRGFASDESLYERLLSDTPLEQSDVNLASYGEVLLDKQSCSQKRWTSGHSLYEEPNTTKKGSHRGFASDESLYERLQSNPGQRDKNVASHKELPQDKPPRSSQEYLTSGGSLYEVPNATQKGGHKGFASDESLYERLQSDNPLGRSDKNVASYEELPNVELQSSQKHWTSGSSLYEQPNTTKKGSHKGFASDESLYERLQSENPQGKSDKSVAFYEELPQVEPQRSSQKHFTSGSSLYEEPNTTKKGSRNCFASDESLHEQLRSDTLGKNDKNVVSYEELPQVELQRSGQEHWTSGGSLYEQPNTTRRGGHKGFASDEGPPHERLQSDGPVGQSDKNFASYEKLPHVELQRSSRKHWTSGSSLYEQPNTTKKGSHKGFASDESLYERLQSENPVGQSDKNVASYEELP